jgi:hypothetical protein
VPLSFVSFQSRAMYEPIHTRRADRPVAIRIGPDKRLSVRVEKDRRSYLYQPRKEA